MQKLKIVVVTFFIALIFIAGGTWGYLWYSTKQQVDQFVLMAKPFADISYGGINISPSGSIGVNRLRAIFNTVNDSITIGSIQLKAPNIGALLDALWQLHSNRLPKALALSVQQVEIAVDGGILGADPASGSQSLPFSNLNALGCGPITAFGTTEWQEMGYTRFISDVTVGYRLNPAHHRIELQIDSHTQDWATLNMDISFATSGPTVSMIELASSLTPKLANLKAVMRDTGFNQRRNSYCAAKAGKAVDAYIVDHVRLVAERLHANGLYLGQGLLEGYRNYLMTGSQLTISASPPSPINPAELQSYKPEDAIKLAGLTLMVNEKPVTDLSLSWDNAKIARALGIQPEIALEAEKPEPEPSSAPQTIVIERTFHSIPTGELANHVGKMAKIKTANNAQYRGKLEAVTEDIATITIRKPSGSATLSLRKNEITQAQVLY